MSMPSIKVAVSKETASAKCCEPVRFIYALLLTVPPRAWGLQSSRMGDAAADEAAISALAARMPARDLARVVPIAMMSLPARCRLGRPGCFVRTASRCVFIHSTVGFYSTVVFTTELCGPRLLGFC